jgi:hypothetical protein
MKRVVLYLTITFNILAIFYTSQTLSISYKEIELLQSDTFYAYIINLFLDYFGKSDTTLRAIPLILYLISFYLFYEISKIYTKNSFDRYLSSAIFLMLPAVISSGLILNQATFTLFLTLLFIYIYNKNENLGYIFLPFLLLIDNSFMLLILSIILYIFFEKPLSNKNRYLIGSLILLDMVAYYFYSFEHFGKPMGHFIDIFAIYSALFSPMLFLYLFYLLYRGIFRESSNTLLWHIASTSFFISLIFSFRQKIYIEDFAPFIIVFIPTLVTSFMFSLRTRLPIYRRNLKNLLYFSLAILVLSSLSIYFNKVGYLFIDRDFSRHFAYKNHTISELAHFLHQKGINSVDVKNIKNSKEFLARLDFYGINRGDKYLISNKITQNYIYKIPIIYCNKSIITYYVSKINT